MVEFCDLTVEGECWSWKGFKEEREQEPKRAVGGERGAKQNQASVRIP